MGVTVRGDGVGVGQPDTSGFRSCACQEEHEVRPVGPQVDERVIGATQTLVTLPIFVHGRIWPERDVSRGRLPVPSLDGNDVAELMIIEHPLDRLGAPHLSKPM